MSFTEERAPTEQEDVLYEHMHAGEWEQIEALRRDAYYPSDVDPHIIVPEPGQRSPQEQFETDFRHALGRYHADHEPPEDEREQNTAVIVEDENRVAED